MWNSRRLVDVRVCVSADAVCEVGQNVRWISMLAVICLALGARAALAISITSFSPTSGNVGTSVTINGTGFSATIANDTVKFNGTVATITSATTIKLVATVPGGATTGRITATVSGATATSSSDFTVKPQVLSFSPSSGPVGTPVTINGQGFSPVVANDVVAFHGTTASVTAASATQLTANVPNGATTGTIKVTVGANSSTSTNSFTVTTSVTGFSPTSGIPGDSIIITGAAFSSVKTNNTVKFNGSVATVTQASTTQLTATVPEDATSGPISVTVGTNTGMSSQSFLVNPTIDGFYPDSGFVGDIIYLWGTGFGDAFTNGDAVTVNGVSATILDSTAEYSDLDFVVPPGAATGQIGLTRVDGGAATSDSDFVVLPSPEIDSFSPPEGPVGTIVTLVGTNFNASPDANNVLFNGTPAIVETATATELRVTVPTGATTGDIAIGSATAPFVTPTPFAVTAPAPERALYVWGVNSDDWPRLAVMDASSMGTIALIPFDEDCLSSSVFALLAINHQRDHLYSTGCSPPSLYIIDTATNTILSHLDLNDGDPINISVHPSSSSIYVTGRQKITVIDDNTGQIASTIDVAGTLINGYILRSALTRDGSKLYVRYQYYDNDNIQATAVVDTSTNSIVQTLESDFAVVDAIGLRSYTGGDGNIEIHDLTNDELVDSLYLYGCPPPPHSCPEDEFALNSDGSHLYDAGEGGMSLFVVDTATDALSEIPIDGVEEYSYQTRTLSLNAQGTRAFVTDSDLVQTQVIDLVQKQTLVRIPTLTMDAVNSNGSTLYAWAGDGAIQSVDTESGELSNPSRTSLVAAGEPIIYLDLASADRLSVYSVDGAQPVGDVYVNTDFNVVVQAAVSDGASSVDTPTTVSISLASGSSGILSEPETTCVIPAGGSVCTLHGLAIDTLQSNARLTVSAVSGDTLTPANSAAFAVVGFPQPVILGFTPERGPVGNVVTITGQHLQPSPSLNVEVAFNGTAATVSSISDGSIVTAVPEGATSGPINVTVAGNSVTSTDTFTVLPAPVVTITDISPRYSFATDPITITVSVTPVPPMTIQPTGTVVVNDVTTNNASCTVILPASDCVLIPPSTPYYFGIVATYGGDDTYGVASSALYDHTLTGNRASIEITGIAPEPSVASPIPIYQGTGVFFRLEPVTIQWPNGYLPSGTVVVSDGTNFCLASMPEGLETNFCTLNTPTPGLSTITAYYSGDTHYATSQSLGVSHATSSPGGPMTLPSGTELCGFDPGDNPAYDNPSGFVPIEEVAGAIPSAGIQKDILGADPLSAVISSPSLGATTNESSIDVVGSFTGPVNTGITVNGIVGYVAADGSFLVPAVPLVTGTNSLVLTATTLPGASYTTSSSIVMTDDPPPIQVQTTSPSAMAPASILFAYSIGALPNAASVSSISIDYTSDGTPDFTGTSLSDAPNLVTYLTPGTHTLTFKVVDSNGITYTAKRAVLVQDMNVQRSMLCDVYGYLKDRLTASDAIAASSVYEEEIRPQYLSLFNALDTRMSSIVSQLGTVSTGFVGPGFAELQLIRDNDNQTRNAYPLRMSRGTDGVWRITGM